MIQPINSNNFYFVSFTNQVDRLKKKLISLSRSNEHNPTVIGSLLLNKTSKCFQQTFMLSVNIIISATHQTPRIRCNISIFLVKIKVSSVHFIILAQKEKRENAACPQVPTASPLLRM